MATQYRGLDLGENYEDVDANTSTTSSNVEISYDDSVYSDTDSMNDLIKGLENIIIYIKQNDFPS